MFLLGLLSCLQGCRMFVYMYIEWTAAKYTGQKSRLRWRKALSQSVSLKHLRGSHSKCWNHLIAPSSRVLGEKKECVVLPSSHIPSLNTLPCSYYYPFFTSNCSVMVIVRSSPWRNYLQLTVGRNIPYPHGLTAGFFCTINPFLFINAFLLMQRGHFMRSIITPGLLAKWPHTRAIFLSPCSVLPLWFSCTAV